MNDTKDKNQPKTLSLKPASTVTLTKTVDVGKIRQNFARGGSKTVTVERRRTRNFSRDDAGHMVEVAQKEAQEAEAPKDIFPESQESSGNTATATTLTESEKNARMRALQLAAERHEEEGQEKAEKEQQQADDRQREEEQAAAETKRIADQEAEKLAQAEKAKKEAAEEAEKAKLAASAPAAPKAVKTTSDNSDAQARERGKLTLKEASDKNKKASAGKPRRDESSRRAGKLTLTNALEQDGQQKMRSLASIKRAREKAKRKEMGDNYQTEKMSREIILPEFITVQELGNRMAERSVDIVRSLMKMGSIVTGHQTIDADTAELVAEEFGHTVKRVTEGDVEKILVEKDDDPSTLKTRDPVVTVMGHVDHGKTSLLDALRSTDVTAGEAGGITQHIGAYQVHMQGGKRITFLDTPGHAAFTAMRSRGASVTDLVILVVAADDGIKQQTVEAINHAKAAKVPIIVAVNKIDKPGADPTRVINELLEHELVAEELGGDIIVVPISAKEKTNLDKLEEAILLQAEMLELKANPNRTAVGTVIESEVNKGKGVVATLLVQRGTLQKGDIVLAGTASGTVRALVNDKGRTVGSAAPSVPVEMVGLDEVPDAGESFFVLTTERQAKDIIEYRKKRILDMKVAADKRGTLEQLFSKAALAGSNELPVIIKADVQGSSEAIIGGLEKISTDEVQIRVIHSAVGGITESDVSLANTSGAIIVGFNVRTNAQARELAEKENVDIRYYSVIYNLIDDAKAILGGLLEPVQRENYLGVAEIRQVFKVTKAGKVAGCFVTDGIIKRGAGVRLLRDDIVIHEGKLKTLKRFKDDAKEVKSGYECGMAFESYDDMKDGDVIEAFEMIEEIRTLD